MTFKAYAKTIGALAALLVALPFNLLVVLAASLFRIMVSLGDPRLGRMVAADPKTVLVSGGKMTKALQLARSFHYAGHRVILIEGSRYWLTGHRFSRAVDRFETVPEPDSPGFAEALLAIVKREKVDVYVPVCSPVASYYDSQAMALLSPHCEVIHVGPDKIELLDDKYQFAKASESMHLLAPRSYRITDPEQIETFDFSNETRPLILKSINYDSVRRLDLTRLPCATLDETMAFVRSLPISEDNPWVMQEFIPGREYCTHGTIRSGELRVHCCCRSSAFQINYEHVDRPEIEAWVKRFAGGLELTGQASFDFIEADDDGRTYAIECNPRTHSAITMYYDHPRLADAYLGNPLLIAPIQPLPSSRPTYWLYHELWRLMTGLGSLQGTVQRLRTIIRGKDAVFDWRDPLPFFMLHHWHIPLLLLRDLKQRRGWIRIDFNIGKLVQPAGD